MAGGTRTPVPPQPGLSPRAHRDPSSAAVTWRVSGPAEYETYLLLFLDLTAVGIESKTDCLFFLHLTWGFLLVYYAMRTLQRRTFIGTDKPRKMRSPANSHTGQSRRGRQSRMSLSSPSQERSFIPPMACGGLRDQSCSPERAPLMLPG